MNKLSNKAFTLIELIIVVAILGVLASMVIVNLTGPQKSARDARRQSDIKQYQTALEIYSIKKDSKYPSTGGSPVVVTTQCAAAILNISNCPDDQKAPAMHYYYASDGISYTVWAEMERPSTGASEFFVICSNGTAGKSPNAPTNQSCPI